MGTEVVKEIVLLGKSMVLEIDIKGLVGAYSKKLTMEELRILNKKQHSKVLRCVILLHCRNGGGYLFQ
ncbi:hypothetical protein CEXT_41471 [Caerostris extrusa]|uniref:Uncharacterized protein n=1 Tax=Caerostris extrusa TaxID=172846 RepID=A0AAV4XWF1_CAEEX|nr:hypothetical protein CEXT_41471 [Caerostris extrusa]